VFCTSAPGCTGWVISPGLWMATPGPLIVAPFFGLMYFLSIVLTSR
jgi:hypothetical protein